MYLAHFERVGASYSGSNIPKRTPFFLNLPIAHFLVKGIELQMEMLCGNFCEFYACF